MPWTQPYQTIADIIANNTSQTSNQGPGLLSRLEPATGTNTPGILVNGHFAVVSECSVFQRQDIKQMWYAGQGGARSAITDFGKKYIEGTITCPILVDREGFLIPGVQAILDNAQLPTSALRIDTNNAFSHMPLTAEDGGSDNNFLLSFDTCLVKELTVTAAPDQATVTITATVIGSIDYRDSSTAVQPPDESLLVRALGWADCDASRFESQMRTTSKIEVTIKNEIEDGVFLIPFDVSTQDNARHDQIDYLGVRGCSWGGSFVEMIRRGLGREDTLKGWMVGENLTLRFGGVSATFTVPVFMPAEQPLGPKWLKRTTKFHGQTSPEIKTNPGVLFTYSEINP
jgi:hypothetical protein